MKKHETIYCDYKKSNQYTLMGISIKDENMFIEIYCTAITFLLLVIWNSVSPRKKGKC